MKKLLAMLLALVMVLSLAACGTTEPTEEPEAPVETPEEPTEEPTEEPAAEATYTLGLGVVVSQNTDKAQVNATMAAVVLDAEGTIVAVDLDVAQSTCPKTDAGVFTDEGFDARTKTEKGADYGMAPVSPIGAEWDAQMAAFEAWALGKTVDYITAVELVESNGHMVAANEADLYAGCTMQITDFQAALADALNNTVEFTTAEEFKLGLGVVTTGAVKETSIEMYSDFAAVVTANDVILAARLDAIQPKFTLNEDGTLTGKEDLSSKYQLKEGYGMAPVSPIGAEWYTQADAYCAYAAGKTAADLEAIELVELNNHMVAANEADLYAGCTMQVGSYIEATVKAIGYAD